ncbi:cupin domain-containing protein [Brasilonema sp. CT11]|nr:cupin domain-containing protein [Brasilonema sp. CT11]
MKLKQVLLVILLVVMLGVGYSSISFAQATPNQVTSELTSVLKVKTSELPKVSELEGEILTLTIAPGDIGIWHTHGSPAFAYVISGECIVDSRSGEPSITLPAGKAIMEPINVVGRARNPSLTEPAKLVLFQLRKPGTAFLDVVSQ